MFDDASCENNNNNNYLIFKRRSLRYDEHNDVAHSHGKQPAGLQHRLHIAGCLQDTKHNSIQRNTLDNIYLELLISSAVFKRSSAFTCEYENSSPVTEKTTSPTVMRKYCGICQAMLIVFGVMSNTCSICSHLSGQNVKTIIEMRRHRRQVKLCSSAGTRYLASKRDGRRDEQGVGAAEAQALCVLATVSHLVCEGEGPSAKRRRRTQV